MDFEAFFEKLMLRYGFEYFGIYYGRYRAKVVDNNDPEQRMRVRVSVATVGHDERGLAAWVLPVSTCAGPDRGVFFPPEKGDTVWVTFRNGDPGKPASYSPGWFLKDKVPAEFAYGSGGPNRRGIVTRAGHSLLFDDTPGEESLSLNWHKPAEGDPSLSDPTVSADRTQGQAATVRVLPDGTIIIANAAGARLEMNVTNTTVQIADSEGNAFTMDTEGVKLNDKDGNYLALVDGRGTVSCGTDVTVVSPTVNVQAGKVFLGDGASQSVVLGEQLKSYLDTHRHLSPFGLTGPPDQPLPNGALSDDIKTK